MFFFFIFGVVFLVYFPICLIFFLFWQPSFFFAFCYTPFSHVFLEFFFFFIGAFFRHLVRWVGGGRGKKMFVRVFLFFSVFCWVFFAGIFFCCPFYCRLFAFFFEKKSVKNLVTSFFFGFLWHFFCSQNISMDA